MNLHANVFGEGKPFVILHGFLGMGDNWKTMGKKIAALGFQVHLVDQRNHGRSPHHEEFTYELLAQDLKEYYVQNNLSESILLGHSMGGKTAMLFACEHPGFINKLIIADIAPKYYPLHHQDILDGLDALDFEVLKTRGEVDDELSTYIPIQSIRMFLLKNLFWESKDKLGLRINLKSLQKNVVQIGVPLDDDKSFNKHTLFLKGERSNYITNDDKELINNHFPKAIIKEIVKAGHWLHAENSSDFFNEVAQFVN